MSVVPPVEENVDSGITGSENIFPPNLTHRLGYNTVQLRNFAGRKFSPMLNFYDHVH